MPAKTSAKRETKSGSPSAVRSFQPRFQMSSPESQFQFFIRMATILKTVTRATVSEGLNPSSSDRADKAETEQPRRVGETAGQSSEGGLALMTSIMDLNCGVSQRPHSSNSTLSTVVTHTPA